MPLVVTRPFAISPRGTELVVAASEMAAGNLRRDQLMIRSFSSLDFTPLRGTEGAASPFFSPDGQWIDSPTAS